MEAEQNIMDLISWNEFLIRKIDTIAYIYEKSFFTLILNFTVYFIVTGQGLFWHFEIVFFLKPIVHIFLHPDKEERVFTTISILGELRVIKQQLDSCVYDMLFKDSFLSSALFFV
jgi:hypothetical protein